MTDSPRTPGYNQVPKPGDLELLDEVTLPSGKVLGGNRARVYSLLLETRRRGLCHKIGQNQGPPGWVPTHVLCEPWSGGLEGSRRVRDLRTRFGLTIEVERYFTPAGESTSTHLYRLADTPAPTAVRAAGPRKPAHPPHHPEEETVGAPSPSTPPPAHPPPLHRLTVWLVTGPPGSLAEDVRAQACWCVTPGTVNRLAPSETLLAAVQAGELAGEAADQAYREELLELYHRQRLVPALSGLRQMVLWRAADSPFDPFPMLERALSALGAKVLHEEAVA